MTTGEKIRHYRKMRGMYQGELAEKVGMTEGAIRHYESGARTPKAEQVRAIASALDVSPLALRDFGVENSSELLALLLQLEEGFGLVPDEDGKGLSIDPSACKAPKASQAIKGWATMRRKLEEGDITADEYAEWKARVS